MLYFFSYLVKEYKYWKQSTNTANIVLLLANQVADIFSFKRQEYNMEYNKIRWNTIFRYVGVKEWTIEVKIWL